MIGVSNVYMYPDEPVYWRYSNLLLANNWDLSKEILSYQPPLLPYLSAILTKLFDGSIYTLRIISVVSGSLTVCFLYLLGKALYGRTIGALSAFLLAFSSFHTVYSRVLMLEAITLLFIVAFLYFFWLAYFGDGGMRYIILAGIMLGLSFYTKYITILLVPALFLTIFWVKRKWRCLIEKEVIIIVSIAFLLFLPLLIMLYVTDANPFYFHTIERFLMNTGTADLSVSQLPIEEILSRGVNKYLAVLTYGGENIPWYYFFQISVFILLPISFFYHLVPFYVGKARESFLVIFFLSFVLFLFIGAARHEYYLIYTFPFYFIMLSNMSINSINILRELHNRKNYINIFRIIIILLAGVFILSYLINGIISPWNNGDYEGVQASVNYIQNDAAINGNNKHVTIGSMLLYPIVIHYIYLNDFNASSYFLLKMDKGTASKKITVDLNSIEIFTPDYIIVHEIDFNEYLDKFAKNEILKKYKLIFIADKTLYKYFIFKRIHEDKTELMDNRCNVSGKMSPYVFSSSIPGFMEIGEGYDVLVRIENTGNSSANYIIWIQTREDFLFVDDFFRDFSIEKKSSVTLKFKMVPLKENNKKLMISAILYGKEYENSEKYGVCRLDAISDIVYQII